jgi:hypothetical protein
MIQTMLFLQNINFNEKVAIQRTFNLENKKVEVNANVFVFVLQTFSGTCDDVNKIWNYKG